MILDVAGFSGAGVEAGGLVATAGRGERGVRVPESIDVAQPVRPKKANAQNRVVSQVSLCCGIWFNKRSIWFESYRFFQVREVMIDVNPLCGV